MFTVSDNATAAIRHIVSGPGVPDGAGLRIAPNEDRRSLSIALASLPHRGDTVFKAASDAPLFIADGAGELLGNRVIDARTEEDGTTRFMLSDTSS